MFLCCGDPDAVVMGAHGRFVAWFRAGVGPGVDIEEVDARTASLDSVSLDGFDAVMISGSAHAAYEQHAWIAPLERLVRRALERGTPLLGVCFGHQLVAQALGGKVTRNPRGREIGTVTIQVNEHGRQSAMLGGLPEPFQVQATHCDTVAVPPPGASVLATSALDDCHAFEIGRAWCVQFHPEVTASIIRDYLVSRRAVIAGEGLDPDRLLGEVRETEVGRTVFARFVEFAKGARRV